MKQELIHQIADRLSLKKLWVIVGLYLHSTDQDAQKFSFFVKFITIFSYQARLNCELCFILWGGEGRKELCHWWKSGEENEFVEHEAFIDSVRVKNAESKIFSRVFMAFRGACL